MNYKSIGSQIRTSRVRMGLTQEELAEACGISASFMGHIERGTRALSIETLYSLCTVLKISADGLLGLSPHEMIDGRKDAILEHLRAIEAIIE